MSDEYVCHYWQSPRHSFGSQKLYRTVRREMLALGCVNLSMPGGNSDRRQDQSDDILLA
jgi:hypothetical protein